jgi:hypothetical protein
MAINGAGVATGQASLGGQFLTANLFAPSQAVPTSTTNWDQNIGTGAGGSWGIDNTVFLLGGESLKVTTSGTATFEAICANIPITSFYPGETVTFSAYLKASAGTPTVRFYCQANNFLTGNASVGGSGSITLSTSWQRYSITVTLPALLSNAGVAWTIIGLRVDTGATAQNITYWINGLQAEPASSLHPWTPGNTSLWTPGGIAAGSNVFSSIAGGSGSAGNGILGGAANLLGSAISVIYYPFRLAINAVQSALSALFAQQSNLFLSFSLEPPVAQPNSTIQVTATATDINGNPVTNMPTANVTVTFPDGSTQSFGLGTGVVNAGSGKYVLTYVTKMPGACVEDWQMVDAGGNKTEYHNVTPVAF